MSNEKNIRIVKGGERFIGSQDKNIGVTPLITTEQREYVEGNRNLSLSLVEQFNDEREYCSRYRPYGKINMVYNNVITGTDKRQYCSRIYVFYAGLLWVPRRRYYYQTMVHHVQEHHHPWRLT